MIIDPAAELARADRHIVQARAVRDDLSGISMQQSYYAMFATARARAAAHDPSFEDRGHRQVQQHLVSLYREDRTEQNPGKVLQRAYGWKQEEDYGMGGTGMPRDRTPQEARDALSIALDFMERLKGDIVKELGQLPALPTREQGEEAHKRLSERGWRPPGGGGIE